MRGEGSRQQELLTLRGKSTPTPGVCGDNAQEPGEDARGTGKERDREGRGGGGAGLGAEFARRAVFVCRTRYGSRQRWQGTGETRLWAPSRLTELGQDGPRRCLCTLEGHGAVSGDAVVTEEGSPAALGLWDKQGTPS